MSLVALACSAVLATGTAAVATRYDLSLATETRHRTFSLAHTEPQAITELELDPSLGVVLADPAWDLTTTYKPRITFTDQAGAGVPVLHEAAMVGRWPLAQWTLSPTLSGSYGTVNLFQLQATGAQPTQVQAVPWLRSIRLASALAQLAATGMPAPRYRLTLTLAGFVDGGATPEDRVALPLQRGARVQTGLEWDATHRSILASTLTGTVAYFSSGPDLAFAVLTETWRYRVTPEVQAWLGAGGSAMQQRRDNQATVNALPSAEAGLRYEKGEEERHVRTGVGFNLAPAVDRVTGAANQRLGVTLEYALVQVRAWFAEITASGGVIVRGAQKRDSAWGGAFRVGRQFGDMAELAIGLRGLSLNQPRDDSRNYDWAAFLALTLRHHGRL